MQDSSLNQLLVVTLIIVTLSGGEHASHATESNSNKLPQICYENRNGHFCANLRAADNVTSADNRIIGDDLNLIINVSNVTWLDLSKNSISQIRFQSLGTIELETGCISSSSKTFCYENLSSQEYDCTYFEGKNHYFPSTASGKNFTENLQTLILSQNNLKNLSGVFTYLHSLQYLDLSHNSIDELRNDVFTSSTKIVTLKLNHNLIESLSKETFESFRNLQSLDLSSNRLTGLNLDIFEYLTNLLILRVNDNYNFSSDAATAEESSGFIFSTGQKFEKLEMAGTSLSKIPIVLTRSIRELDLSNNSLRSIQCGEMDSYPLLQRLILQNNLLIVVEEDSLGRLECLIELNLHGNSLRNVPLSLPWSLQTLNLGYNMLENIDKTDFNGLVHLRTLILKNNKIERIDEFTFSETINLEQLDLSSNPITLLTSEIFVGPKGLKNLQLANLYQLKCEEGSVCNRTFPLTELERLEVLNLEASTLLRQQLVEDQSVLLTLKHLKELNLIDTNITELSPDWFNHLRGLQSLDVRQNPLNCSKSMHWFKEWLQNLNNSHSEGKKPSLVKHRNDSYLAVRIIDGEKNETAILPTATASLQSDRLLVPRCHEPMTLRGTYILDLPDDKLENQRMTKLKNDGDDQKQGSIPRADTSNTLMFGQTKTVHSTFKQIQREKNKIPSQDVKKDDTQRPFKNKELETSNVSKLKTGSTVTKENVTESVITLKKNEKENRMQMKYTIPTAESESILSQPIDQTNKADIPSSATPDTSKAVPNTLLINKDNSYDEVFYQNDAPEGNMGINRAKIRNSTDGSNSSTVTSKSGSNDARSNEPSMHALTDRLQNETVQIATSMELDRTRIIKHEVKSINKTHIEISRLGQRAKQLNSTVKTTRVNDTKLVRPREECEMKNNEPLLGNISTKTVSLRNQSTNSQDSLPLQNSSDAGPLVIEPCDARNGSKPSIEITTSSDSTTNTLTFQWIETTAVPYRQQLLNNSSKKLTGEQVGKPSTINETSKANSNNRRKSVRKMKNVDMRVLETLTSTRRFREDKTTANPTTEAGTTEENAKMATVNYEISTKKLDTIPSPKTNTGKNVKQDRDASQSVEVKDGDTRSSQTHENKEGDKSIKSGRKNEKKRKQSKLLVIVPTIGYTDGKDVDEVTEKSTGSEQNDSEAGPKNNYIEKNRQNNRLEMATVRNSGDHSHRENITVLGALTTGSIKAEQSENVKDGTKNNESKKRKKGDENEQGIADDVTEKTNAENPKGKFELSGKNTKTRRTKNEDFDRSNSSVGSKITNSSPDLKPIPEALGGVTHNSSDKIQIYAANTMKAVDNKSSPKSAVNTNKYNSNLGGIKDDPDKGGGGSGNGSHPGMLIFLLVISVLLFTLSLMLISHWTWCRQLNSMYELSADQQILGEAESDFEINSLTNFKDHERW